MVSTFPLNLTQPIKKERRIMVFLIMMFFLIAPILGLDIEDPKCKESHGNTIKVTLPPILDD
jgi:hypothetical protein